MVVRVLRMCELDYPPFHLPLCKSVILVPRGHWLIGAALHGMGLSRISTAVYMISAYVLNLFYICRTMANRIRFRANCSQRPNRKF